MISVYDCQAKHYWPFCEIIGDAYYIKVETVELTDEELEAKYPWLKECDLSNRFGRNFEEYDIYTWLRLLSPEVKEVRTRVERNIEDCNLVARDLDGKIIRIINAGCFNA